MILLIVSAVLQVSSAHAAFVKMPWAGSPPNLRDFRTRLDWNTYNKYRADSWQKGETGEAVQIQTGLYIEGLSNLDTAAMLVFGDQTSILPIPRRQQPTAFSDQTNSSESILMAESTSLSVFRVSGRFSCELSLHRYPNDRQTCSIRMMSFSYTTGELEQSWFAHKPIQLNPLIKMPEMDIVNTNTTHCDTVYVSQSHFDIDGTTDELHYSCLQAEISLQRRLGYHIVQTYLPSMLTVAISWVSFWIDPNAAPARATLSVTTLLTLTTQAAGVRYTLPPVSYAKAIDLWMGFCTCMIFASLLEYALVNSLLQRSSVLLHIESETYFRNRKKKKRSPAAKHLQTLEEDMPLAEISSNPSSRKGSFVNYVRF